MCRSEHTVKCRVGAIHTRNTIHRGVFNLLLHAGRRRVSVHVDLLAVIEEPHTGVHRQAVLHGIACIGELRKIDVRTEGNITLQENITGIHPGALNVCCHVLTTERSANVHHARLVAIHFYCEARFKIG